jgi:hypothetical protein
LYIKEARDYYDKAGDSNVAFTDPTTDSFRKAEGFHGGRSKSSQLMTHLLSSTAAAESYTQEFDAETTPKTHCKFTNLFPWPEKEAKYLRIITELHASHISMPKPLIILPLSDRVFAVT